MGVAIVSYTTERVQICEKKFRFRPMAVVNFVHVIRMNVNVPNVLVGMGPGGPCIIYRSQKERFGSEVSETF